MFSEESLTASRGTSPTSKVSPKALKKTDKGVLLLVVGNVLSMGVGR